VIDVLQVVLARKPLQGSFTDNVIEHGVACLNIDGCRVKSGLETGGDKPKYRPNFGNAVYGKAMGGGSWENTIGRFPANVIHDGSEVVALSFPYRKTTWVSPTHANNRSGEFLGELQHPGQQGFNDDGSASRFFWSFK